MQAPVTSNFPAKVKPESSAVASAKRKEVTQSQAAASPDKRARVESETSTPASNPIWKCDFCDHLFADHPLAVAHENACQKRSAVEKTDSVMEDKTTTMPDKASSEDTPETEWAHTKEEFVKGCVEGRMNYRDNLFFEMVVELRQVKETSGVAWVKGQRDRLGNWCYRQKVLCIKHRAGEKTSLNEGRIKLLNHIGFPWSSKAEATPQKQSMATSESLNKETDIEMQAKLAPNKPEATPPKLQTNAAGIVSPAADQMDVEMQPQVGSDKTQATPEKTQTETENKDEGRVVSPPANQSKLSIEAAKVIGLNASPSPPSTGRSQGMSDKAHSTPPKLQSNEADANAERVVSPPADQPAST